MGLVGLIFADAMETVEAQGRSLNRVGAGCSGQERDSLASAGEELGGGGGEAGDASGEPGLRSDGDLGAAGGYGLDRCGWRRG